MSPTLGQLNNVNDVVTRVVSIGTVIIYVLVALAFVYIVWAVVQYLVKGKEGDEARSEAGMKIFWGIVGLAIIVSLWGLVNLLINTFWTNTNRPDLPTANFVSNSASTVSSDSSSPLRYPGGGPCYPTPGSPCPE